MPAPDPPPPSPVVATLFCGKCRYDLRPIYLDRRGDTFIIFNGKRRVRQKVLCHICGTFTEFRSLHAPELRPEEKDMDIDAMEAGRELDARVARAVPLDGVRFEVDLMGNDRPMWKYSGGFRCDFSPSTSIEAAWVVFEVFCKTRHWDLGWHSVSGLGEGWFVSDGGESKFYSRSGKASDTAPLAICRAALKAIDT